MRITSSDRGERSAVLIIRLWIEANHQTELRARLTQRLAMIDAEQSVAVAASADDICAAVRRWVDDFTDPRPARLGGQR